MIKSRKPLSLSRTVEWTWKPTSLPYGLGALVPEVHPSHPAAAGWASSEGSDAGQRFPFNEAEATGVAANQAGTEETIAYQRQRKKRDRRDLALKNFPVERSESRLPPEEQHCASCEGRLRAMGNEIRRELKVIPATVIVVEHGRYKSNGRHCERETLKPLSTTTPVPRPVHPGSLASAYLCPGKR